MGIPDYWKIADPTAEVISFKQLAADEGLSDKRRELGLLRVGVDLCDTSPLILAQVGLPKCGMSIAHGLARSGFGDSLLAATQTMSADGLQQFLVSWREDVRAELATNARGHLKSKQKSLAAQLPDNFPRIKVLNLYAKPTTSWSDGYIPLNTKNWRVKLASLPELALFLKKKFGWKPTDIVDKFRRLILPVFCLFRTFDRASQFINQIMFLGICA
ncbi:hypothetical protein R3P38DRAFT_766504 [Favolaschia claudopus]|uniref:Uncharacterized protein n=1 Tax=Favolaschia claudopus TaxID=2862362 RepID=A0AAV9Z348_9AGAR